MTRQIPIDARQLLRDLAPYGKPDTRRSVMEILVTAVPFVLLWALIHLALSRGIWIGFVLTLPAGGLLLRLFLIQHDCGHGALFRRRRTNDWVGRAVSVLTLTPYDYWRRSHAKHHATSGNLGKRGTGDVDTLTVSEFAEMSAKDRWRYRLYRSPIALLGIGPAYQFILRHRLPIGSMRGGWSPWLSALGTNAAIALIAGAMIWWIGLGSFLMVHIPIVLIAASAGVWLFYVQHQFEQTSWEQDEGWSFHEAAIYGSSHYDLPPVLRWFTANIGVHHVHHLSSRIPFYRLPEVLRAFPQLRDVSRVTMRQSLGTLRLKLWDEDRQRLVPFSAVATAKH
ncbi:fatty acid desaturase [Altererythrobacter sp. SALINAS58]|uniref:fatty acid desaturase n=1 Tax=Alteripontixanthobacter muriae TaxID=2705546 RepID=UPI001575B828|nr:fatty acid desaturase [Alteripontixanthobacter muriae]NTZ41687.1 fatty acid desaturase [Alteripontixanthobacter muriae]